jgi:hypothetical protein
MITVSTISRSPAWGMQTPNRRAILKKSRGRPHSTRKVTMAKLVGLELLDCIAKAESQGKSWEEQCLEADYVTHVGTPNTQAFSDAVDKAKRHLEIIRAGSLHPFLSHGYTKTPVSRQNKRLNQIIEEFSSLVSLSYIDRLEEDFMDNFDEIGNPDGEMYEYDFGVFDSQESAKQYVLGELDAGWWISYFEGEKNTVLKNSGFKNEALSLMSRIKERGGSDLLNALVTEAIEKQYEGILTGPGLVVTTNIAMREWERGDLVKWLGEGGNWKHFCLSLRRVCENELSD